MGIPGCTANDLYRAGAKDVSGTRSNNEQEVLTLVARMHLGVAFSQGSGKLGNVVLNKGKGGDVTLRERVKPNNPRTAGQLSVRASQTKSSQLYKNMTSAQVLAWTGYAATLPQVSRKSGRKIKVSAINAFCQLADKFFQASPNGTAPMIPPTSAYTGDSVGITATAVTGAIQFSATAPNSAGTKTELLLQPLKGKNRVPTAKGYRTKAFVAFSSGTLFQNVSVPAGYYAAAYRFVNVATGQMTALTPIAIVTVALSLEDGGADEGEALRAA